MAERNWRRMAEEEELAGDESDFWAYGQTLVMGTSFRYLGRILKVTENRWTSVTRKIWKARRTWERISHILVREGADTRTLGRLYLAAV